MIQLGVHYGSKAFSHDKGTLDWLDSIPGKKSLALVNSKITRSDFQRT